MSEITAQQRKVINDVFDEMKDDPRNYITKPLLCPFCHQDHDGETYEAFSLAPSFYRGAFKKQRGFKIPFN